MFIFSAVVELVVYLALGLIGLVGNSVLLHGACKCLAGRRRTSCMLLLNIAIIHLTRIVVVNVLSIIYSVGGVVIFDMAGCKLFKFTFALTNMLAIWFTLYVALFYIVRLDRVVHPATSTPRVSRQTIHLVVMLVLWAIGLGVSCPLLVYADKAERISNVSYSSNQVYTSCQVNYTNPIVHLIYALVILTAVDLGPLVVLLLVSIRIAMLLKEHHVATYGDIWIGEDKAESEIFMASKLILPLVFLLIGLWVSHFALLQFLDKLDSYYFIPVILAVLSSAYSALSPYICIAISSKVRQCLRPSCFSKPAQKSPQPATILSSPYAE